MQPKNSRPPRRPKRHYTFPGIAPLSPVKAPFPVNRLVGAALIALAATLVVTHEAEHAGVLHLMPLSLEDMLIGFPSAGLLGVAGFIAFIWR